MPLAIARERSVGRIGRRGVLVSRVVLALLVAGSTAASTGPPVMAAPLVMYSTAFSAGEGYAVGSIAGQQGWVVQQPAGGDGFAVITDSPPGPSGNQAVAVVTGTGANPGPLYAVPAIYSGTFATAASQGYTTLVSDLFMYLPSGQTSAANVGALVVDTTGARVLTGFWVDTITGIVSLVGNVDLGGGPQNVPLSTGTQLGFDAWVNVVTLWNRVTGEYGLLWDTNAFGLTGAAAGADAQVTLLYADWLGGSDAVGAFFDELQVTAVPEPATGLLAAVAAAMLAGCAWRRRGGRAAARAGSRGG